VARKVSGKRYAQAVFELAQEGGHLDRWASDLEAVDQAVGNDDFRAFLKHADVPAESKFKAIGEVLPEVHPLIRNLVDLLVTNGLVDLVPEVRESYGVLLDEHLGRQRVQVVSAVPLNPQELEQITQFVAKLAGKEVVVSTQVDEAILGGVVIQIGDQLLDGSTRSRLDALRGRLHLEVMITGA
jgi:F-type H+-transporting ATPase subunit delta